MIKTPLSTVIGGAFWTPEATVINGASKTFDQIIKSLFANNEQGFAYDPNDLTTMWQDQAKLLPVTGEGQPVWHILDKSVNNNHAFAASSATRPILRQNAITKAYYLAFDGADDFLVTNNIDFTSTDKVSVFAGVKRNDATSGMIAELGNDTTNNKFFLVNEYRFLSRGSANYSSLQRAESLVSSPSDSAVLTASGDISANLNTIRYNGVNGKASTASLGAGSFINSQVYIGRRGGTTLPFNGHLYSLIGIGRLTTDAETTALEKLIAKNTGVTLSV